MKSPTCIICNRSINIFIKDLFDDRYGAKGRHSIYRCSHCGFGKTIPGIRRSQIGKFYSDHYPLGIVNPKELSSQIRILSPLRAWLEGVDNVAHLYTRPGIKVLDIGSASGISLLEIGALGGEAYGVEPDPHGKQIATKLHLRVHQGFIADNPFPKIKFDLITASQVIEHEPTPLKFLVDIRQKLAKNGQVVLSFPNYDALYRHIFLKRWIHWHIPYHLNFFTETSFKILADQAGFTIKSIRTITPNLWTIQQLRVLLAGSQEGVGSPAWTQDLSGKGVKNIPSIFYKLLQLAAKLAFWLIMPINRLVDSLGLGESYLVVLQPKDNI
jgi:SAM-dependent methyltransferase